MNTKLVAEMLRNMKHPIDPPGCTSGFVDHPAGWNEAVEIGVVLQHRFAFYYWLKWHGKRKTGAPPPNLLTIDWHDDVGGDCDFKPEQIEQLNPKDENELSLFCWAGLRCLNDGHIAPAQYLNAIGDVYVILKQHGDSRKSDDFDRKQTQTDRNGNSHQIHYFDRIEDFLAEHGPDRESPLYLDIDLDYFTRPDKSGEHGAEKRLPDAAIKKVVSLQGPLMQWVVPRLAGFTIALEPEYCGGIRNCMHILDVVSTALFDPPLLTAGMKWRVVGRK